MAAHFEFNGNMSQKSDRRETSEQNILQLIGLTGNRPVTMTGYKKSTLERQSD